MAGKYKFTHALSTDIGSSPFTAGWSGFPGSPSLGGALGSTGGSFFGSPRNSSRVSSSFAMSKSS